MATIVEFTSSVAVRLKISALQKERLYFFIILGGLNLHVNSYSAGKELSSYFL